MLKIRDSNLNLLTYIDLYTNDSIEEAINAQFELKFTALIDEDGKSEYLVNDNIVEVEDNYFRIVYHRRSRQNDGTLQVQVTAEHVSNDLLNDSLDYFTVDGTPKKVLTQLLNGTDFTIGQVDFTDTVTFSTQQTSTKRAILIQFAQYVGGELEFDKFSISLLTKRGQNRGVQFRVGKNVYGITKDVDKRSGTELTSYGVTILELDTLDDYNGIEYFGLGDTVKVIDKELDINEPQRIVKYTYSPKLKMNSKVDIANYIPTLTDTITNIQRTTVKQGKVYNGIRISPTDGFEAIRSDNMARSLMNATEGIRLQTGDGSGNNWTDAVYFDINTEKYKFNGTLEGVDGSFSGTINANQIDVSNGKITTAQIENLTVGDNVTMGSNATISWNNVTNQPTIPTVPSYIKSTYIDSTQIQSPTISGGTIIGSTIETATSGQRLAMDLNGLRSYDSNGIERVQISPNGQYGGSGIDFHDEGSSYQGSLFSNTANGFGIASQNDMIIRSLTGTLKFEGNISGIPESAITNLTNDLGSKASLGVQTKDSTAFNGGIPIGTRLAWTDSSGNVAGYYTWTGIPAHSHTQQ